MFELPDLEQGLLSLDPFWIWVLVGLSIGIALLAWAWVWTRMTLKDLQRRTSAMDLNELALSELLSSAPEGFYAWIGEDRHICSRHMAIMLGLIQGTESDFDAVLAALAPDSAARLENLMETMNRDGIGFSGVFRLAEGGRSVELQGKRITTLAGVRLADVLWCLDVTEAAQAQAALNHKLADAQLEAKQYRAMLDALPMPVWLRGEDLALLAVNRAYGQAVDALSAEAVLGDQVELASEDQVREARALAATARAARESRVGFFSVVLAGRRSKVAITEMPFELDDHLMTAGFTQDQTELEELETQFERHVSIQREVLEHLSTAIAIYSTDTRLSFNNTAYARLWRLDPEWLASGPTYGEILDILRERRALPEVVDYRAYKDDETRLFTTLIEPVETLMHLPDGRTLRRVVSAHPHGGLILTYEDVTDTLALERSFNTVLAVQRETLDHLHEALAVRGGDGRLKLFNPAFARLWGLDTAFLAAQPHVSEIVEKLRHFYGEGEWTSGMREGLLAQFSERRLSGGRVERGDGVILGFNCVPLPDGATLLTWLDMTDTQRMEKALRDRNEALTADDSLKSQVIANVSSEVRKPLDAIVAASQTLQAEIDGALTSGQRNGVEGIVRSVTVLDGLVTDILDMLAFDAGQMTLELNTVDIVPLLVSVMALVRERAREAHVLLDLDCPPEIGWIVADERRLKQVLFNLINDMIACSPVQAHVMVSVSRHVREFHFRVTGTGTGNGLEIPATPAPQGNSDITGLRRALLERIVELHGGQVEWDLAKNGKTSVLVRLPSGMTGGA